MQQKNIIFTIILFLSVILTGCTTIENKNTTIKNKTSIQKQNTGITIPIEDYNATGFLVSTGIVIHNNEIVLDKQNKEYNFFKEFNIIISSEPKFWEYSYNSLQKSDMIILHNTKISSITQTSLTINRWYILDNNITNRCKLFKENAEGNILSFHESQKKINNIIIDTIISKIRFEFNNIQTDNQFGMACFTKGNYQYTIGITRFNENETKNILGSIIF